MGIELSQDEIDKLLGNIKSETQTADQLPSNVSYYNFATPYIITKTQEHLLESKLEQLCPFVTKTFTQYRNLMSRMEFISIHQKTSDEYFKSTAVPTYMYKFTSGHYSGYIDLDPFFVDKLILRRNVRFKNETFDPLDLELCKQYFIKPILENLKEILTFDGKPLEIDSLEYFPFNIEPVKNEMGVLGLFKISSGTKSFISNIYFGNELIEAMKTKGIFKDIKPYVSQAVEKGNTLACIGNFYLNPEESPVIGTTYELDKNINDKLDILQGKRVVAKGDAVLVKDQIGVRISEILSAKDQAKLLVASKFGDKKKKEENAKVCAESKDAAVSQDELNLLLSGGLKKQPPAPSDNGAISQNELDKLLNGSSAEKEQASKKAQMFTAIIGTKFVSGNITAVLGDFILDSVQLEKNNIFILNTISSSHVTLYRDGNAIAHGEIVNINGKKFAVNVTDVI